MLLEGITVNPPGGSVTEEHSDGQPRAVFAEDVDRRIEEHTRRGVRRRPPWNINVLAWLAGAFGDRRHDQGAGRHAPGCREIIEVAWIPALVGRGVAAQGGGQEAQLDIILGRKRLGLRAMERREEYAKGDHRDYQDDRQLLHGR